MRHLIDLLDGAVSASYDEAGLDYRPRYTPVMRALMRGEPCTIGQIALAAQITQPAATQTIALMLRQGLIEATPGPVDGRQKMISLSAAGRDLLPKLEKCWKATEAAARSLDADMPFPLSEALASAIAALQEQSFGDRIQRAKLDRR